MVIFHFGLETTTKAPISKPTSIPPSKSNYYTFSIIQGQMGLIKSEMAMDVEVEKQ